MRGPSIELPSVMGDGVAAAVITARCAMLGITTTSINAQYSIVPGKAAASMGWDATACPRHKTGVGVAAAWITACQAVAVHTQGDRHLCFVIGSLTAGRRGSSLVSVPPPPRTTITGATPSAPVTHPTASHQTSPPTCCCCCCCSSSPLPVSPHPLR